MWDFWPSVLLHNNLAFGPPWVKRFSYVSAGVRERRCRCCCCLLYLAFVRSLPSHERKKTEKKKTDLKLKKNTSKI
jgi:hypothetical protein